MYLGWTWKWKSQCCCCFTWIVFIEINFTVAFLLMRKTCDYQFASKVGGWGILRNGGGILVTGGMILKWGYWSPLFFASLPSPPLKTKKIRILKIWKNCWRYHHFTYIYQKLHEVWGTVPEIKTETDKIFVILGHFPPWKSKFWMKKACRDVIILHLHTKNHNHMMYASWDI